MHISPVRGALFAVIGACLFACGPSAPGSGATDDASSAGSSGSSGAGDPTTATSATSSMTSVEPTTDVPTPTGSGGSTGGTTGSPGADLAGLQESCERFCDSALACLKPNPYPDLASCVWLCVDTFDAEQPVCVDAYIEANNCLGGLECPGFIDALTGGQGACSASQAEIQEVCQPACKWAFVDGGPATCSIGQTCPVGPPSAYECNGATCACNVDGEVQKECPADGLCGQGWEAQVLAANACCGFDF